MLKLFTGIYPAENPELLDDLLRKEFGFEGFYMTDWTCYDTVDLVGIAAAGNSFITPGEMGSKHVKPLVAAVKKGTLSRGVLEDNVRYIIRVLLKRSTQAQNL
jgi:beta-glucosidase